MNSQAELSNLVLTRRLADGTVEWIPLAAPQHVPADSGAAYALIDRTNYEAPQGMVAERQGEDLVIDVNGTEVLVLDGFFAASAVTFYPTPDIAGGAGPFSGSPLTPEAPVLAGSPDGEQVVWSAEPAHSDEHGNASAQVAAANTHAGGGGSPLLWGGLAVGALGLGLAAAGGGGSGGGSSTGGGGSTADTTPPNITSSATATSIPENSGAGQVVYTATATDASSFTWSLAPTGDAAAFSIDPTTGAVTLNDNPDYETKPSYSFTVVATDSANNHSQQVVTLSIENQNDSAPFITSGAVAAAIDENSGADQVVYTATATDAGPFTWSLATTGDAAAFSIDATTGAVTLIGNPDYETQSSYSFTVVATDEQNNVSQQKVSLAINNLDEVAPTITSGGTASAIDENSGAGQVVYTVTADDSGDISNGVTFRLKSGSDAAAFSINTTTGAVTLTDNPNYEAKSHYDFTVVATDAAGNRAEQAVGLDINNVDEVAPTITSSGTAPAINENSGANQSVYTVKSTDNGDISTGNTTYSLSSAGDGAAFSINATSGVVRLTTNPDFEAKASYSFTVVATDAAGNSSQKAVSLAINNLDEVAPTITSGSTAPAITENSGANQVVYTVTSTDTGDISTGNTTYGLSSAGDGAAFTINATSGAVRLITNPDYETKASYSFTVVATDAAGNSGQQAVSLAINNVIDETAPTVGSVALTGATGAQNNTLNAGDTVQVTVTMSENTNVDTSGGTPRIALDVGGSTDYASYASGSGSTNLVFNYTVQPGDTDSDGIAIPANALQSNGGSLTDPTGNVAVLSHGSVTDDPSFKVDTTAPTVSNVALTGAIGAENNTLNAGDTVQVTVTMSENTLVSTSGGTPRIDLNVGNGPAHHYANYVSGSGTTALVFQYTVQPGDTDSDGISISSNSLKSNGGSLTDLAGNAAALNHSGIGNDSSFLVDTTAPTLSSSTPADNATNVAVDDNIVLTFSDNVQAGSGNITISDGSDTRTINVNDGSQVSISGNHVTIDPTADLDAGSTYNVQMVGGALTDLAGNAYAGINNPTTLNFDTQPGVDTSVVVFDLVQGSSSDHSGRTFQSGVSYDIYIRVDSTSSALSTSGGGPGTWGTWSGAANLGSDDRVILVGDGTAVQGVFGSVNQVSVNAGSDAWLSTIGHAGTLQGASFNRVVGIASDNAQLFNTALPSAFLGGQDGQISTMYANAMPAGILTSQGLV